MLNSLLLVVFGVIIGSNTQIIVYSVRTKLRTKGLIGVSSFLIVLSLVMIVLNIASQ